MNRRDATEFIVIHTSATRPNTLWGRAEIDHLHRTKAHPFSMIGYHQVIRRNGVIEFGRHFDARGAHVKGQNFRSIGICLVGGLLDDGSIGEGFDTCYTPEQKGSLIITLQFHMRAYPNAVVVGHRDLSPDIDGDGIIEKHEWIKNCPCFDASDFVREHILLEAA